jgi:hypothetical protein
MKKMLCLVMVMLVSGSVFGQGTNAWKISEKYDRNCDGWVKGGPISRGQTFGVANTSGKMGATSALRVGMSKVTGEIEAKKTFKLPDSIKGKQIAVEALLGYNLVKNWEGPTSPPWVGIEVKLLDKNGEVVEEKKLEKDAQRGELSGTVTDMEINRFVFSGEKTTDAVSVQVRLRAKADGRDIKQGRIYVAELWIKSLTIKEQE